MTLTLRSSAFFAVDVPAALAFYRAAFGLSPSLVDPARSYAEFEIGGALLVFVARDLSGTTGMLGRLCGHPAPGRDDDDDVLCFRSDDLARDWNHALAAGAIALAAPANGVTALLRDPGGIVIELSAQARDTALPTQKARPAPRHRVIAAAELIQASVAGV